MFQYPSSAVNLFNNLGGITTHLEILSSEDFKQDGEETPIRITQADRVVIFIVAILSEVFIWFSMVLTGTLFVFQSISNEEVIRSTVAITFIMNIDELIYSACCPAKNKKRFSETSFESLLNLRHAKEMLTTWMVYCQLYFLMSLSFIIVAAMRSGCLDPVSGERGFNFFFNTKGLIWDSFNPP